MTSSADRPGCGAPSADNVPCMPITAARTDPASRPAASWQARYAALKSRQVGDTDPRVTECLSALAYWRCRRVIDAERDHLSPQHVPALSDMLKHAHPAVSA